LNKNQNLKLKEKSSVTTKHKKLKDSSKSFNFDDRTPRFGNSVISEDI